MTAGAMVDIVLYALFGVGVVVTVLVVVFVGLGPIDDAWGGIGDNDYPGWRGPRNP